MASLSDLKGAFTFLLMIVFVLILSYLAAGGRDRPTVVNLEGRIYERCVAGVPMGPVRGATISTSIDAVTATTDQNGRFRLVTSTPSFTAERHLLTARHGEMSLTDGGVPRPGEDRTRLLLHRFLEVRASGERTRLLKPCQSGHLVISLSGHLEIAELG